MRVWAVPCVGDDAYLRDQMRALDLATGGDGTELPPSLTSPRSTKPRFGALSREALAVWVECGRADLPVDLLYAPHAIRVVLETLLSESGDAPREAERATLYLHTGGLEGLESQLDRYRRAGMLE